MGTQQSNNYNTWQPLWLSLVLVAGIFIGKFVISDIPISHESSIANRIAEILHYIDKEYVDTVNTDALAEHSIQQMLEKLDPHTVFIPPKEITMAHSQLEGNFEGVGIEFYIFQDTIVVASPIPDGPSDKVGILGGDRIMSVDSTSVAGVGITSNEVFGKLRGPKGSPVKVSIKRLGEDQLLNFTIIRGKIPTSSIDAAYMHDTKTGYIKISRFSESTFTDFQKELTVLKENGMLQLILDLRDNPGGYLDMAIKLSDEFLGQGKLIVYTLGKNTNANVKQYATEKGGLEVGQLIVLINQGSASASEIVAGAIQDNDRGLVVGSRSFGKGLVQRPIELSNGAELRLTTSRYYTPSGRCIQKPYDTNHPEEYGQELNKRYLHGEYFHADSINFANSLKYKTQNGRTVYGGGGIMPDFFVPQDTSEYTNYAIKLLSDNFLRTSILDYYALNIGKLKNLNQTDFINKYSAPEQLIKIIIKKAEKEGIKFNEREYKKSQKIIGNTIKAYLAKSIFGTSAYYKVLNQSDRVYQKATGLMDLPKMFDRLNN